MTGNTYTRRCYLGVVVDSEVGQRADGTVLDVNAAAGFDDVQDLRHGAVGRCLLPIQVVSSNQIRNRSTARVQHALVTTAKTQAAE